MPKTNTQKYFYAVGRRKSAITTIKLFLNKGESLVNKITLKKYFPSDSEIVNINKPFVLTDTLDKFHFQAKIIGGGKIGQLESLVLAISRALVKYNETLKPVLRQNGFMTVDARVRQRRMIGTGGKARRAKQSPRR